MRVARDEVVEQQGEDEERSVFVALKDIKERLHAITQEIDDARVRRETSALLRISTNLKISAGK